MARYEPKSKLMLNKHVTAADYDSFETLATRATLQTMTYVKP